MYYSVLKYFLLEDGGIIAVSGVEKRGDILSSNALKKACELGESI